MKSWRRRLLAITIAIIPALVAVAIYWIVRLHGHHEITPTQKPEAPPDLEKLRSQFTSGLDALQRRNGAAALKYFSSNFSGPC